MKLRNLFLAGIAAFAMASCSNEVEGIDNGDNGTKDAIMQFGISFANSSNTGVREAANGGEDKGILAEQNFTDATIVIEQEGKRNILNVLKEDFKSETSTTTTILWLKEKIAVNPGEASVWVFLNASSALKSALSTTNDYKTLKETASFTGNIKALENTGGIAEANHFLMSNATRNLFAPYNSTAFDGFIFQKFVATETEGAVSNYCMENLMGDAIETYTNVIYKGEISVNGKVGTLYITSDNKAFTSVEEMAKAGYNFAGLTESTSIDDCWNNYALRKYDKGVCYYVAKIETAGQGAKIVRNNIYRLKVNSIKGIGSVLPKTFDDPTLLNLKVGIEAWTVNDNAFNL